MKKKNSLMTTIAILGLATISMAQLPSNIPSDGLVGYWPFNGNANDESVNGNNGTVNGAILSSDRFGNSNAAYSFDGIDDWILIENQEQFNFNNRFTINAWINTNTVLGTKKIVTKLQDCDDSYILQLTNNQIDFQLAQGCGNWISYNNIQENLLNNWHALTATFDIDSALVKLYFDGGLISEQARDSQVTSSTANLVFGNFFNNGMYPDQLFFGLIDDIGVWNRALTQEEITSLYSGSSLGINEDSQFNLFSVYPNPAQNEINVNIDTKLVGSVFTIYDNIGKVVKIGKLNSVNTSIELNDLSGGIYTFSVGENKKQTFKVIKE
jgi:hypothetical protein